MDKDSFILDAEEVVALHKTTYKQKQKDEWIHQVADYYVNLGETLNNKAETKRNLNAINCILDDKMTKDVLAALNDGKYNTKLEEIPIMDDLDIITPIKERYLGEFIKSPAFYTCTVESEDITLALQHKIYSRVFDMYTAKLQQKLIEMKDELVSQNMAPEEVNAKLSEVNIKDEIKQIKEDFFKAETVKAKNIVESFVKHARMNEKFIDLFYNFLATEEAYVEFEVEANKLVIKTINPVEYLRIPSDDSIYTEDDEAGVIKSMVHIREILDKFDDQLSKEDKGYLKGFLQDTQTGGNVTASADIIYNRLADSGLMFNQTKSYMENAGIKDLEFSNSVSEVPQYKIYMKTKRKIGHLTYTLPNGAEGTKIVGDTYKFEEEAGDIHIEWEWIDEVMVGYRFGGDNGVGVYIPFKPIHVQRNEANDRDSCKIPVIGTNMLLKLNSRKPIGKRLLPFQTFYTILTHKIRQEISKFHGFINLIPESILSESSEFTQLARLEYMYKDNILMFNDSEVNVNVLQAMRSIGNTGQADYIKGLYEIRDSVKAEGWDSVNMNNERYGAIDVKGGMGNTQESIRRVSTGSVLLFTMFDLLRERIYQAISDYGRIVYIDGLRVNMLDPRGKLIELDINHEELISSDYGIHFTTGTSEKERLDLIRNSLTQLNMQGGRGTLAIDIVKEDDLESIRERIVEAEEAQQQYEAEQAEAERKSKEMVEQLKSEAADKKLQVDLQKENVKGEYGIKEKEMDIYINLLNIRSQKEIAAMGNDGNFNGTPDGYDSLEDIDKDLKYLEANIKKKNAELLDAKIKNEKRKPLGNN